MRQSTEVCGSFQSQSPHLFQIILPPFIYPENEHLVMSRTNPNILESAVITQDMVMILMTLQY